MIDPAHSLPLTKQAAALGISRSSIYYLPQPVSERDQALMNRLDRLHLDYPFAGTHIPGQYRGKISGKTASLSD